MNNYYWVKIIRFYVLIILFFIPSYVFAVTPDAGQILREQQQNQTPSQTIPTIEFKPEEKAESSLDGEKVKVSSFRFVGDVKDISEKSLQALVTKDIGQELSFGELNQTADRVTQWLQKQGYSVARAYLVAQEVKDGVIEITILLGTIEGDSKGNAIDINGHKLRLNQERVRRTLAHATLDRSPYLKSDHLERGLLLLNDLPGISTKATLEAGKSAGTTRLSTDVSEGRLVTGQISTDNFGNRYTGSQRYNTQVNLNSPFGLGDQLFIQSTIADDLYLGKGGYSIPVGYSGLRMGVNYTDLTYKIGKEFSSLDAKGRAQTANFNTLYPFIRTQNNNLYGMFDYDYKALRDESLHVTTNNKRVDAQSVTVKGDFKDMLGGGGLNYYSTTMTFGNLDLSREQTNLASDEIGARTKGGYNKFNYNAARLQRLIGGWSFFSSINGQVASKNLDSSEKFILGGPAGVRAYTVGEGSGDQGWVSNAELRYDLPWRSAFGSWQAVSFYDIGTVTKNKNTWSGWNSGNTALRNHYYLSGAGVGLNFFKTNTHALRVSYAWALGQNHGQNANGLDADGKRNKGRFWLQFVVYF